MPNSHTDMVIAVTAVNFLIINQQWGRFLNVIELWINDKFAVIEYGLLIGEIDRQRLIYVCACTCACLSPCACARTCVCVCVCVWACVSYHLDYSRTQRQLNTSTTTTNKKKKHNKILRRVVFLIIWDLFNVSWKQVSSR